MVVEKENSAQRAAGIDFECVSEISERESQPWRRDGKRYFADT